MIISPVPTGTVAHIFSAQVMAQNATTGDGQVGWVSTGNGRSTSDILWSCFSILLVCTWKCIHFNVPSSDESNTGWHRWGILYWPEKRLRSKWMYKLLWMIFMVLAPEIGIAIAMDQYLYAGEGLRQLKAKDNKLKVDESKEVEMKEVKSKEDKAKLDGVKRNEITMTHAFFTNMGGFTVKIWVLSHPKEDRTSSDRLPLDEISQDKILVSVLETKSPIIKEIICEIRDCDTLDIFLKEFPDLRLPTETDIKDLSKADAFTKAFACVQSTWLIIQSIARVYYGLPITQLELATMAFVICALIMYILWWDKPFGVERRTTLTAITYQSPTEKIWVQCQRRNVPDLTWGDFLGMSTANIFDVNGNELRNFIYLFGGMVRNMFIRSDLVYPSRDPTKSITLYLAGTMFSSFHIGAWNWEFPSPVIQTLWKIFALTATCVGPSVISLMVAFNIIAVSPIPERIMDLFGIILVILIALIGIIYIISRLSLVVLIFYCFSSMPAGVYDTVAWTTFLPHFS